MVPVEHAHRKRCVVVELVHTAQNGDILFCSLHYHEKQQDCFDPLLARPFHAARLNCNNNNNTTTSHQSQVIEEARVILQDHLAALLVELLGLLL